MKMLNFFIAVFFLAGCSTSSTYPVASRLPIKTGLDSGFASAKEFSGIVENWESTTPFSSTLSVWIDNTQDKNYVFFQIRANLDTYRFTLSRDSVEKLIDALDNYKTIVRQTVGEKKPSIGWLYQENIKMKRMGEDAKDDRLIVNIERTLTSFPVLTITFNSWLLSFGGPSSPAQRAYKSLTFQQNEITHFCETLNELVNSNPHAALPKIS